MYPGPVEWETKFIRKLHYGLSVLIENCTGITDASAVHIVRDGRIRILADKGDVTMSRSNDNITKN